MHQSNYVVAGCGYDWTAELGGWDTFIAEGWVQTLIAFFILVMSARVLGKFTQLYAHQLVGYMLLGRFSTWLAASSSACCSTRASSAAPPSSQPSAHGTSGAVRQC